jgi:hypothetical protein
MDYAKAVSPLVTALTVVAFAAEAIAASDDETLDTLQRHRAGDILVQKVLVHMDGPHGDGKGWVESHMAIRKGTGIVYRYNVTTDDKQKVVFSVGGPVIKRGTFGMLFEVRF